MKLQELWRRALMKPRLKLLCELMVLLLGLVGTYPILYHLGHLMGCSNRMIEVHYLICPAIGGAVVCLITFVSLILMLVFRCCFRCSRGVFSFCCGVRTEVEELVDESLKMV